MSDDLIFGVALKSTSDGGVNADVKSARDDINNLKKATDELAASSAQSARGQNNDWAALQKRLNDAATAHDNARDKAWALSNGYKEMGGQLVKTGGQAVAELEKTAWATARAQQEMVVLGREVAQGNFSRMPGTLSIIAQGLSGPVLAGIGAVAAAAAAGALAWESYSGSIEKVREDLELLHGDLALKTLDDLNKLYAETEKLAQEKRAAAASGGWGWLKDAQEAAVLEAELRRIGEQIDANKAKEIELGNAGGIAAALTLTSQTAKRRELERQIELLQIYHDKQIAGSTAEIDSTSKLIELREKQAAADKKRNAPEMYIGGPNDSGPLPSLARMQELERAEFDHQAKLDEIKRRGEERRFQISQAFGISLVQFEKQNAAQRASTLASGLMQMTAVGAAKNRELFEINKIASIANATISGIRAVQDSYAFGATWGGPVGGAIMAAIAVAATAANLAAINSTQFGGGGASAGGGGIPSLATSPGVPVSVQPPVASAAPVQAPQQFHLTIVGAKADPDAPIMSYNAMVDEFLPMLERASNNGAVKFNLVMG